MTVRNPKYKTNSILRLHSLQAYQKFGDELFKPGIEVRHLNGIKTDNTWDNIAIGTVSENQMDIPKHKRISRAQHAASFLKNFTDNDIREIRKRRGNGEILSSIGEFFGIGKGHVSDIVNRKLYKDIH